MKLSDSHHLTLPSIAASLMLATSTLAQDLPGAPPAARFLEVAARELGAAPGELTLGSIEGPVVLEDAGLELYLASATIGDGEKTVVALAPDGTTVHLAQAFELDRLAAAAGRGKIAARLADEAAARPAGERLMTVAWLSAPSVEDARLAHALQSSALDEAGLLDRETATALEVELAAAVAARIEPVTAAAAARFSAAGLRVVGSDVYAPLVFVDASLSELGQLAADPEVEGLDWAGTQYGERLDVAAAEVRAHSVWSLPGGVTGHGAKVSIVENGMVCTNNPYMTVSAVRWPEAWGAVPEEHATAVASCVASKHPTHRGIAPDATLISANMTDFVTGSTDATAQMPGSVAAVSWSVNQGAQVLNLSYGAGNPGPTVSSFDKYLDYVARYSGKTIAIACGNSGALAGYAGDPGAGYNQVAVGNFLDMGSSAWTGEAMSGTSSWKNPSTGVETPQVAAPGYKLTMLACPTPSFGFLDTGTSFSSDTGTSFSSPIAAGVAALMISKQAVLGSWPEAVRAILMATAWHNIEGLPTLSSKDGAGGIDALAAVRAAAHGKNIGFNYGVLYPTSFDISGFFTALSRQVTAGEQVRVCLSFDSTPTGVPSYSPDVLKADLDLYVYDPNGALVAQSIFSAQPFEIVRFAATQTGKYTVKIKNHEFTGTSEFFGMAMSLGSEK